MRTGVRAQLTLNKMQPRGCGVPCPFLGRVSTEEGCVTRPRCDGSTCPGACAVLQAPVGFEFRDGLSSLFPILFQSLLVRNYLGNDSCLPKPVGQEDCKCLKKKKKKQRGREK